MALTPVARMEIGKAAGVAKKLEDALAELKHLNITYDSSGGLKETITLSDLNGDPALSGLTKVALDDGMFALTATIRTAIEGAYSQIIILSKLA